MKPNALLAVVMIVTFFKAAYGRHLDAGAAAHATTAPAAMTAHAPQHEDLLESPLVVRWRQLMAEQRGFQINVMGNSSKYFDNVHAHSLQLLRYCEPSALPWNRSDELGVKWDVLRRSFVSTAPRPCRINYIVDAGARPALEAWLNSVFRMAAAHAAHRADASTVAAGAGGAGMELCSSRRQVDNPITEALRVAGNASAFAGLEPVVYEHCLGTLQLEIAILPYELFGLHEPFLAWMEGVHHGLAKIGGLGNMRAVWLSRNWAVAILPADARFHMSMDADTLILDNLDKLFELFNDFRPEMVIGLALEQYAGYAKKELFGPFIEACPTCRMGRIAGFPGMAGGVALLHLEHMRVSRAFQQFYHDPAFARRALEAFFTKPEKGFTYPDQDVHTLLALLRPELFYVLPCMWNWQLSHAGWWPWIAPDDILPGQHIRTCLHPPKIMHGKLGLGFSRGAFSHRREASLDANGRSKWAHVDWPLPDVTGGEEIEAMHGGPLPGHVIDMCVTQCASVRAGLLP